MLTPAAYFIIIIIINSQGRALKSFPFEAYLLTITFATYLVQYITQKYLHNGKAISRIRFSLLSTLLTFKFHIFCTPYLCFNIIKILVSTNIRYIYYILIKNSIGTIIFEIVYMANEYVIYRVVQILLVPPSNVERYP